MVASEENPTMLEQLDPDNSQQSLTAAVTTMVNNLT